MSMSDGWKSNHILAQATVIDLLSAKGGRMVVIQADTSSAGLATSFTNQENQHGRMWRERAKGWDWVMI